MLLLLEVIASTQLASRNSLFRCGSCWNEFSAATTQHERRVDWRQAFGRSGTLPFERLVSDNEERDRHRRQLSSAVAKSSDRRLVGAAHIEKLRDEHGASAPVTPERTVPAPRSPRAIVMTQDCPVCGELFPTRPWCSRCGCPAPLSLVSSTSVCGAGGSDAGHEAEHSLDADNVSSPDAAPVTRTRAWLGDVRHAAARPCVFACKTAGLCPARVGKKGQWCVWCVGDLASRCQDERQRPKLFEALRALHWSNLTKNCLALDRLPSQERMAFHGVVRVGERSKKLCQEYQEREPGSTLSGRRLALGSAHFVLLRTWFMPRRPSTGSLQLRCGACACAATLNRSMPSQNDC